MTPFTTSKGEFIAVPVPSMAFGFDLQHYGDSTDLIFMIDLEDIDDEIKDDEVGITKHLPFGNYEIIGLSSDILKDEELAKKVVDNPVSISVEDYKYPEEEFQSLLDLHNITGNQLIIKKK